MSILNVYWCINTGFEFIILIYSIYVSTAYIQPKHGVGAKRKKRLP